MLYYKRHIGDYMRDAAHLSLIEHGAYVRLMDVYYGREAPLPEADVLRLLTARSKEEIAAVKSVLNEFWTLTTDGWIQGRCDHEIGKARDKAEKNRANGQKGGRPARRRTQAKPKNNPDGSESETMWVSSGLENETLSNNPTNQLTNKPTTPSIRSEHESAEAKPKNNPDGFEAGQGEEGKGSVAYDTANAWRDAGCDAQAYESWLAYRAAENDRVPDHVRMYQAMFLRGKGTPEEQRAFVGNLIQRQFKRLHEPGGDARPSAARAPKKRWHPDDGDPTEPKAVTP